MRTAIARRHERVESAGSRPWLAPVPAVAGAAGILVGASIFFGAGSSNDRLVWIGGAAIVVATVAVVLASMGVLRPSAPTAIGLAAVAFFAAFVVWQGLTVLWSVHPDRSWDYFNRAVVYLALLLLGIAAGGLRRAPRVAAAVLAALIAVAVACALATKVFPGLSAVNDRIARLSAPIGYWNALALLVDMGIPLALWIAAPRTRPHWLRAVATLFLYASGVALLLTFSRGGLAVGVLALAFWFWLGRPRLESAAVLAIALVPMLAVVGWSFTRKGLTEDAQPHSVQVHDGRWFALALALGGLVAFGGAYAASLFEERRPLSDVLRLRLGRVAAGLGAAALALGIGALLAAGITPARVFHKFSEPTAAANVGSGTAHLSDVSSSARWAWWRESWDEWRAHPVLGTGAGSFDVTHRRLRTDSTSATEPHNLPLQFLTETGIVGFVLFLGIGLAGAAAVIETLRRLEGEDRLAGGALAIVLLAYVVHGVVDFDWDFVAVTAPAIVAFGVLLGTARPALGRLPVRRTLLATAAGGVAAAALYSLLAPWLATHKLDDAYSALGRGDAAAAVADARSAHDLNPASIDPLLLWAQAERLRGDQAAAGRLYTRAIALQPDNWFTWYSRARFLRSIDGAGAALFDAQQAAKRDPLGTAGLYAKDVEKALGRSTSP
jgi:hypothetical protein